MEERPCALLLKFPGTNCDAETARALEAVGFVTEVLPVSALKPEKLVGVSLVVFSGGFSYGDYVMSGRIASLVTEQKIGETLKDFRENGGYLLGICNGFQVLTECGLLPGALMRNVAMRYICKDIPLAIERADTAFTRAYGGEPDTVMPVGNGDGRFYADGETLAALEGEGRVVFRYLDNPNGSSNDIAGLINGRGNVLGMMPHPDRCADPAIGRTGGWGFFQSLAAAA